MLATLKSPSSSVWLHFSGSQESFAVIAATMTFHKICPYPEKNKNKQRIGTPSFIALVFFFTDSQERQGNKEESNTDAWKEKWKKIRP